MSESARISTPKLILGLAVIAVGVLLTLDNLGVLDAGDFLIFWPLALIAIGVAKLPGARRQEAAFAGLLILAGVWLQAYFLGWTELEPWLFFWPIVLVLIGANLIVGALRRSAEPDAEADSVVNGFAFLGAVERRVASRDFRGGDVTAIMGACEVDLRDARIAEDPESPPRLHLFAFWGGIEVRVPEEWSLDFRVLPFLGGATAETRRADSTAAPTLVVTGMAIMGGIEIKNSPRR